MADQNLRFPPDSTGKRVGHTAYIDISFTGGTGAFAVGDTVTALTSGVNGTVIKVTGTVASGAVHLLLGSESPAACINGEALQINAVTKAMATDTGMSIYVQNTVNVGANNPKSGQYVDNQGAAFMRFAEGSPQFDAFGKLQVSQSTTLGDYVLRYDAMTNQFQDVVVGVASLVHSQNFSGVTLSTGTASGDKIQRTSHEYHCYQPGVSQVVELTVALGDAGKANLRRNWGYFDDDNGLFFQVNGLTAGVVSRSKGTGAVVDEVITRTNWNGDRLDGLGGVSNISGILLDLTKDNIYWIDLQWLGAGRARFGVIIDGVRITCHSGPNANTLPFSYMGTGSLPIRAEQFNSGIVASTSEMKLFCCTVKTEGAFTPLRRVNAYETPAMVSVTSDTVPVTALALRPLELFKGIANRCALYPQTFDIYNAGPDAVAFEAVRNATETSGTWANSDSSSATEVSANMVTTGGRSLRTLVIPAGQAVTVDFESFSNGRQGLRRNAIASTGYSAQYYRLKTLAPAKSASVRVGVTWEEVQK